MSIKPYAILDSNNIVVNITICDGDTSKWQPDSGFICVGMGTHPVSIGNTYNSSGVGIGTTSANKWIE